MNNHIDSDLFGKRDQNTLTLAFTASATENETKATAYADSIANGTCIDTVATAKLESKARTASKYQKKAIAEIPESSKKALLKYFNVGKIYNQCTCAQQGKSISQLY